MALSATKICFGITSVSACGLVSASDPDEQAVDQPYAAIPNPLAHSEEPHRVEEPLDRVCLPEAPGLP